MTDGFSPFAVGVASADLAVTDAALASEQVGAGETVSVTATVENTGDAEGTTTLALTVDGETHDELEVSLSPGERTEAQFTTTFDEAGEYTVAVEGTTAGDLSVGDVESSGDDGSTGENSASGSADDESVIEEQAPGFGPVAAVVALLALALLVRRE